MAFADPHQALSLFLSKLEARSQLGPSERKSVLSLPATPRQVDAHREIVRLGEVVDRSCLVASGLVGRFQQTYDGKRQIVAIYVPGDMADIYSLMIPAAPSALVALTPTTVFHIPHSELRRVSDDLPAVAAALWRDCVADGLILAQWLLNIGRKNARGRLAHLFCELAVRYQNLGMVKGAEFPMLMTQEQIADTMGLTPRSCESLASGTPEGRADPDQPEHRESPRLGRPVQRRRVRRRLSQPAGVRCGRAEEDQLGSAVAFSNRRARSTAIRDAIGFCVHGTSANSALIATGS